MQIAIDIPEIQKKMIDAFMDLPPQVENDLISAIRHGISLPKGHGRLIDENEILRFLKCPKYESCDWKNCFDCNDSRCINLNNINDLASIIEAESENTE